MEDIFVRPLILPPCVRGVTVVDENGDYNVYVNSSLPSDLQEQAVRHELRHIKGGHFYNFDSVRRNENEADAG